MAKEIEKYDMNISYSEATTNVKQELDDDYCDGDKTTIFETIIVKSDGIEDEFNLSSFKVNSIDTLGEISAAEDLKNEHENDLDLANHSHGEYQGYSSKCDMLTDVLNKHIPTITCDRVIKELPNDILEMRISLGQFGIFALIVIPEGVRIGPFTGLSASQRTFRIKGGRFVVAKEQSKYLNWMQYINPANNSSEQNMLVFQHEGNIYYRSCREIQQGEELLVYFGEEYEDSLHKNIDVNFIPYIQHGVYDVFACMLCCLGFRSRIYLVKHKTICENESGEKFSVEELTQCQTCKIYLYKKEYLESHVAHCKGKSIRKCILPTPPVIQVSTALKGRKRGLRQIYKCEQYKYRTKYQADLKEHTNNQHYKFQMYKCGICNRRFKTKALLRLHVKNTLACVGRMDEQEHSKSDHSITNIEVEQSSSRDQKTVFKCSLCEFRPKQKRYLRSHIKNKHAKQFDYKCDFCEYRTNNKSCLKVHIKSKHQKQYDYKCDSCEYGTNRKSRLETHIKTKHLKQFVYKCDSCKYGTDNKSDLETHIKTNHLKEFDFRCDSCEFGANIKSSLERHIKTIHLKEFDFKCDSCEYGTNRKLYLRSHIKTKHMKEFDYKCDSCEYGTNVKRDLENHIKTKHLKEFDFTCDSCEFGTNVKSNLERHIKAIHLKQYYFKCDSCEFGANIKSNLERHIKAKHLKEFDYKCDSCEYGTNVKRDLESHIKTKHLKEFDFKCDSCEFGTNIKSNLERHIKAMHLKEYYFKCDSCEFGANIKSNLERHIKAKHLKEFDYKCDL